MHGHKGESLHDWYIYIYVYDYGEKINVYENGMELDNRHIACGMINICVH